VLQVGVVEADGDAFDLYEGFEQTALLVGAGSREQGVLDLEDRVLAEDGGAVLAARLRGVVGGQVEVRPVGGMHAELAGQVLYLIHEVAPAPEPIYLLKAYDLRLLGPDDAGDSVQV
jgi:hypothetical protein